MKVLKATLAQKQALEGTYLNGAILQFVEDKNKNWVVNQSVLNDVNFESIHEQLSTLPLIDFEPKQSEI
jgi:hypothetical protein